MKWVPAPSILPMRCAAVPFIRESELGFIDTGSEMSGTTSTAHAPIGPPNHVYISVSAIRDMAQIPQVGLVDAKLFDDLHDQISALTEELRRAHDDLVEANRELDAVEFLKGRGYKQPTVRKKEPVDAINA